jgi:hypothetical protein
MLDVAVFLESPSQHLSVPEVLHTWIDCSIALFGFAAFRNLVKEQITEFDGFQWVQDLLCQQQTTEQLRIGLLDLSALLLRDDLELFWRMFTVTPEPSGWKQFWNESLNQVFAFICDLDWSDRDGSGNDVNSTCHNMELVARVLVILEVVSTIPKSQCQVILSGSELLGLCFLNQLSHLSKSKRLDGRIRLRARLTWKRLHD